MPAIVCGNEGRLRLARNRPREFSELPREVTQGKTRLLARTGANHLQATPPWGAADQRAQIKARCDEAASRDTTHHTDHIIPLVHPDVCGLHVPWNLQVLTAADNLRKSNSFDGTLDNAGWCD